MYVAFINNLDCSKRFSFHGHPSTSKFLVRYIWLYVYVMSRTLFRVNLHSRVAWLSRNSFLKKGSKSEVWVIENWTWTNNELGRRRKLNYLAKFVKWLRCVGSTYLNGAFDYGFIMSHALLRVNPNSIVAWMSRKSLLETDSKSDVQLTATSFELKTSYFGNEYWTI